MNAAKTFAPSSRPTPAAGELEALQEAMGEVLEILSYGRKHGSATEAEFTSRVLLKALWDCGAEYELDAFGNVWVEGGAPASGPAILWSCHIDTVHAKGGRQSVQFALDGRTIELVKQKPGRCLGADNGAGVWLLLEMIRAGVPGGYVFHRGEEVGRLGSEHVSDKEADRLIGYDACVAFDRKGYDNLITHQMGMRCASEAFSESFGSALNTAGRGFRYSSDDGGSYTDSYSYAGQISECANVSVGYAREHGPKETLDALHLWRLRNAMVSADFSKVLCERDPTVIDYGYDDYHWGSYGGGLGNVTPIGTPPASSSSSRSSASQSEAVTLANLIERFPAAAADLLMQYGLGCDELLDVLTQSELSEALAEGTGTGWAMS